VVPAPPPAKQISEPIVPEAAAVLLFVQTSVRGRFPGGKGLLHISPEMLLPEARILPDPHPLFDGCGIGKYDVPMAPVMNHADSTASVTRLLGR
jgi:hypothetical protein